jgi:hypothetical protein
MIPARSQTMRPLTTIALAIAAVLALSACMRGDPPAPPPPAPVAAWTAQDSADAAKELIDAALKTPWASSFRDQSGRLPRVSLGTIDDRSGTAVDAAGLAQALGRALAASGKAEIAADKPDFTLTGVVKLSQPQPAQGKDYDLDLRLTDAAGNVAWNGSVTRNVPERLPPPPAKPAR